MTPAVLTMYLPHEPVCCSNTPLLHWGHRAEPNSCPGFLRCWLSRLQAHCQVALLGFCEEVCMQDPRCHFNWDLDIAVWTKQENCRVAMPMLHLCEDSWLHSGTTLNEAQNKDFIQLNVALMHSRSQFIPHTGKKSIIRYPTGMSAAYKQRILILQCNNITAAPPSDWWKCHACKRIFYIAKSLLCSPQFLIWQWDSCIHLNALQTQTG